MVLCYAIYCRKMQIGFVYHVATFENEEGCMCLLHVPLQRTWSKNAPSENNHKTEPQKLVHVKKGT